MKKLIALIPTTGKSKEEILAELLKHAQAKGYLLDEKSKNFTEYEDREDMLISALESAKKPAQFYPPIFREMWNSLNTA